MSTGSSSRYPQLEFGDPRIQSFGYGPEIGSGFCGPVYDVQDTDTEELYAMKRVLLSDYEILPHMRNMINNEISVHKLLDHPNIVKLARSFVADSVIHILTDLCEHGDLQKLMKEQGGHFSEPVAKNYIYQIAQGIKYLHKQNIVHRDLKLSNIFIATNQVIKIGDFGSASKLSSASKQLYGFTGTPAYIAPEMYRNQYYSFPVEMWALGIIGYTLLIGRAPFVANSVEEFKATVLRGEWSFPEYCDLSYESKELIRYLLDPNPTTRWNINQVLGHSWFNRMTDDNCCMDASETVASDTSCMSPCPTENGGETTSSLSDASPSSLFSRATSSNSMDTDNSGSTEYGVMA